MGGRNRRKGGRKKQNRDETPRKPTSELIAKGNLRYECYYALQGIHDEHWKDGKLVPCETDDERNEERIRWVATLKETLPASFRIGKDVPKYYQKKLSQELEDFIRKAVAYQPKDDDIQSDKRGRSAADFAALADTKCHKLSFLPFAYQLSLDRVALRRNPALKDLQLWLTTHAEEGHITRQETVSMIPPVLLDVDCNDRVLDMCAAPGSKTSQMLEDMSSSSSSTTHSSGVLVANDCNTDRANMLAHQLRRILYHHPVALITAAQAQNFPKTVQFDKILCDVPCSGDGTSRKNVDIWLKWSNGGALGLHALQLQIARRGIDLLKVGGTMCYSTCSQNPIENEAVVAELLRQGNVELVEKQVEGFVTRPGRSKWKVFYDGKKLPGNNTDQKKTSDDGDATNVPSKDDDNPDSKDTEDGMFNPTSWKEEDLLTTAALTNLQMYNSFDDVPQELRKKIRATAFPPTDEEAKTMHLERCIRCLPQDNNTGGFFSAVLQKVAPMTRRDLQEQQKRQDVEPAKKRQKVVDHIASEGNEETSSKAPEINTTTNGTTPGSGEMKDSRKGRGFTGKDNFVPVPDDILDSIVEYYGMTSDFPRRSFHYRALGEMKTLFYVAPTVVDLFDLGIQDRITSTLQCFVSFFRLTSGRFESALVINTGLKAFARKNKRADDVEGDYRICQESVHFLGKYMTKRIVTVPLEDLKQAIDGMGEKAMSISLFSQTTQDKLNKVEAGSFVMMVEGIQDPSEKTLLACMWRNKAPTVDCFISKIEVNGMRMKIASIEQVSCST